jgi:HEPN domain-containing protein
VGQCQDFTGNRDLSNRHADWFRQAEADLRHARHSLQVRDFEWACFAAHQASEKAVKAVFLRRGQEAWGHTLSALLGRLGDSVPAELVSSAKVLDKHYIPSRYPNGFDSGIPADFYTEDEAKDAIGRAEEILEFCGRQVR